MSLVRRCNASILQASLTVILICFAIPTCLIRRLKERA